MAVSDSVFREAVGRPPVDGDCVLVYIYDGVTDKVEYSTLGSLDIMNMILAYGITKHIEYANEVFGEDMTSGILRAIFEQAKARLGYHGNN